jgi:DtxR family Mn-dependent transcriptional regulator
MSSSAVQDYLKTIYHLSRSEEAAGTSSIAERLNVAAASVTGMLKRLAERGLVEHVPYYGARLTAEGEDEAVRLIRRHRVLELFLVQVLGYTWDRVHEEAERLEHAVTDELIDRMAAVLGGPEIDPHGAPIPGAGEHFVERTYPPLSELAIGCPAVLRRVPDEDPEALRYLASLDLMPGARLEVLERAPFNGPVRLRVQGQEQMIGAELSRTLQVEPQQMRSKRQPRKRSATGETNV